MRPEALKGKADLSLASPIFYFSLMVGFVAGSVSGFAACSRETHPTVDLRVSRLNGVVRLDGVLDEEGWRAATRIEPWRTSDGTGTPRQATQGWISWDAEALFFAFECQDADVFSSYGRRDDPLYLQEVMEIFLDADGDRQDYLEFEVSPANQVFDASFTGRRQGMDLAYNPTLQSAVRVEGTLNRRDDVDRGWTVELSIPFLGLTGRGRFPPHPGDRWRMNVYRLDQTHGVHEASSWRPVRGDFHDLDAFGVIQFAL